MSFIDRVSGSIDPRYSPLTARIGPGNTRRTALVIDAPDVEMIPAHGHHGTNVVAEFRKHKKKWLRETRHLSSPIDRYMHPSYVRIIGLGPSVLGILFADLKAEKNDWFYALQYISGSNPVTSAIAGDFAKMVEAWIKWGEENSYI